MFKKSVIILLLSLAFCMLYPNNDEKSIKIHLGLGILQPNNIIWGVTNSSLTISQAKNLQGHYFHSANGFQIGSKQILPFLTINNRDYVMNEQGLMFTQNNYKLRSPLVYLGSPTRYLSEQITRNYLSYFMNLRFDFFENIPISPYIGFGLSCLLSDSTGLNPNKTWVNDIPLNVGINIYGFTYQYSHGTYPSQVIYHNRAKTNTHSFSYGITF